MKKYLFALGALFLSSVSLTAQTSVVPYRQGDMLTNGLVYRLPKMALEVGLASELTISRPGPFANYAARYLSINNPILTETRQWTYETKTNIAFVPDETKAYLVAVNNKTTASNIQLDNQGIIVSVNSVQQVTPLDVPTTKATAAAIDTAITFDLSQLGEEALIASSIPKMAELAAKQIYTIRESRTELLSGQGDKIPDGESMRLMLERLDKMERELMALFIGKSKTMTVYQRIRFVPEAVEQSVVLFRFSPLLGVLAADNLAGRPIILTVQGKPAVAPTPDPKAKKEKTFGLFYNVTGSATFSLADGSRWLSDIDCVVPQFGYTAYLPAKMFDQPTATQVLFGADGAINSINQR